MLGQELEQLIAFRRRQSDDGAGVTLRHEQARPAVHGVATHDRVVHIRYGGLLFGGQGRPLQLALGPLLLQVAGEAVNRAHAAQPRLHRRRQRLVGPPTAAEHRVAHGLPVAARDFDAIQQRVHVRGLQVGGIGVPQHPGVGDADPLAVFRDVGDDGQLRMVRHTIAVVERSPHLAEAAREFLLLLGSELLAAQHDDRILVQCIADEVERAFVHTAGDVHAPDLCAERLGQRNDAGLAAGGRRRLAD